MALIAHWKLEDTAGGLIDDTGNLAPGTFFNSPSVIVGIDGNAVAFDGVNQYASVSAAGQLSGAAVWSMSVNCRAQASTGSQDFLLLWQITATNNIVITQETGTGNIKVFVNESSPFPTNSTNITSDAPIDLTDWSMITVTADHASNTLKLYANGQPIAATQAGDNLSASLGTGTATYVMAADASASVFNNIDLDDVRVYDSVLSDSEVAAIWFGGGAPPAVTSLPTQFEGFIKAAATALPTRFTGLTQTAPASLGMRLESPDPTDYLANAAGFSVQVIIGTTDYSDRISGPIDIEASELSSGIASLSLIPPNGPVDPNTYERQPIQITFIGSGYTQRRFTGITSTAVYDPDQGELQIEATTNLQGQLENLPRSVIDNIVGGLWSEHVFDDTADGWQYARDRLSTIASELHADVYGHLIVTPWETKATPDFTLTDAERFDDTLDVVRSNLRDLITRVRINFDFRFTRLRHREIVVHFRDELGFCDWANRGWLLPARSMVAQAADGSQWNRTSDITYDELPPPGTYCTPERGWAGDPDLLFCLGASWSAARRWAQTVTEEYGMDLIAPDLEESIGVARINADYGVEATYDSTDYEIDRDFTAPPDGSSFSTKSFDWQIDADQAERDGRVAMEAAQEVAMAAARSEILDRARKNRVSAAHIYYPPLQIRHTVRINTPYLQATGKVARLRETLDPVEGIIDMQVDLAVSRHDGSGLAVDDPLTAPPPIEQPQEENTGRTYTVGYTIGGEEFSPPDDDTWDGYVSNVDERIRFPGAEIYRTRFVLRMPEVETEARDALTEDEVTPYEVAVPQDELTMSR